MQSKQFSLEVGGKTLSAEFTDLAEQANGSVLVRYGNTAVLATAVISSKTRDDIDYFPLTVDYEERFYAAGAILGSRFMRREGRPSEQAILSGRVVDRTIRPLFPQHLRNEVQVVITVLALEEDDPDTVAVIAASLALATSDIPWGGPVAAVRIGMKGKGDFVINPTFTERHATDMTLEILACGKDSTINMIEVGAHQASEDDIAAGFVKAVGEHDKILEWQNKIITEIGKTKREAAKPELPAALLELFENDFKQKLSAAVFCGKPNKDAIHHVQDEWKIAVEGLQASVKGRDERDPNSLSTELAAPLNQGVVKRFFEDKVDEEIHRGAVEEGKRADNRRFDEVRPLFAQAGGVSSILHGSGIFYRGGTHVFSTLTLGGPGDSQIIDSIEAPNTKKRFMHHYNFPPYSAGETGRMGGINRRAVGHGALAEKALLAVLPPAEQFPYTIRLVSECMASNGSTSMGSVCASTLALMDGGVPIVAPVAGIAMGLMLSENFATDKKYKVLTDIQGPEDEFGDMDFKVAGTRAGVTAIQMDIKLGGVPVPILIEALAGAKAARLHILDTIEQAIAAPRAAISQRAPEILTMHVRPDQIGLVIGGGGKTINGIKEVSKVNDITIEDDGSIFITGKGGTAQTAKGMIEAIVKEYKPGEVYEGEVTRMMDFGAFVRIGPGKDAEGLVHVSEVAPFRIDSIAQAVSVGERVRVMIKEIDDKGRLNLSIKAADPDFATRKGLVQSTNPHGTSGSKPSHSTNSSPRPQKPTEVTGEPPKDVVNPEAKAPAAALQSGASHIDMGSILLPKKETPGQTPASAQRINAGALLEQEQHATLVTPAAEVKPASVAPTPVPAKPAAEETTVKSLETYQGDIESLVKDKNISVLSIATAEAERRNTIGSASPISDRAPRAPLLKTIGLYLLGFLLLAGASGALAYIVERPTSLGPAPAAPTSPFISVDDTKEITISSDTTHSSLVATLSAAKDATALSLGLVSRLLVTTMASSTGGGQELVGVNAQNFFSLLAPNMPAGLLRTLNPPYLLGVHVYDGNQAFIILSVDSYEQAYAGMLAWEPYMKQDLSPLFNYTPAAHIPEEGIATPTINPSSQFIQTGFTDTIVENHDARVIENDTGDITLLWTFIDRNTLVIATEGATVREIISRLTQAPITPQPGQ